MDVLRTNHECFLVTLTHLIGSLCVGFIQRDHNNTSQRRWRADRRGLCGVQGSPLNQYPTIRPQSPDVLRKEKNSCFIVYDQKNPYFLIHIVGACVGGLKLDLLNVFQFLFSFTLLPSNTVGFMVVCVDLCRFGQNSLEKLIYFYGIFDKGQTKTQQKLSELWVGNNKDCWLTRLTGDNI